MRFQTEEKYFLNQFRHANNKAMTRPKMLSLLTSDLTLNVFPLPREGSGGGGLRER
jgi:hypothetical protein